MTELDPITQEVIVETEKAIANLEALIRQNQRLAEQAAIDAAALENLQQVINGMEGKRVFVDVEMTDRAAGSMTDFVSHLNDATGAGERVIAVNKDMTASIIEMTAAEEGYAAAVRDASTGTGQAWFRVLSEQSAEIGRMNASLQDYVAHLTDATGAGERAFAVSEGGIAVERNLGKELRDAANAAYAAEVRARGLADARAELASAGREVGLSDEEMARLADVSGAAIFRQGEEAKTKADKIRELTSVYNVMTSTEESTLWIPRDMAQALGMVAAEAGNAGQAAQGADRRFRIWGTGVRVTGYGLHWLLAGSTELLAVLIPAIIAAADAAAVMAEGFTQVKDRLTATYQATEATAQMLHKTTGTVMGLKSALQQAQTQADPMVWELFGSGVSAAKEAFGNFWQQGLQVVHMLDTFAAHVDLSLGPGGTLGSQTQSAIHSMVADLQGLGQVLGNVGHILLTVATSMPGIAEVILHLVAAITGLANSLAIVGAPAITAFFALEELGRWSGLLFLRIGPLVTGIGGLIGKFSAWAESSSLLGGLLSKTAPAILNVGVAAETAGAEMAVAGAETKTFWGAVMMPLTNPIGQILLMTAAITALFFMLNRTKTAAQQMTGSIESAINVETPAKGLVTILQDLPKLQSAYDATSAAAAKAEQINTRYLDQRGGARAINQNIVANRTYAAGLNQVQQQLVNLLSISPKIDGTYYSLSEEIGLASAAGVQMNQMFDSQGNLSAIATQMIKNLINGYQMMAQTGTTLANDINAINVQTLMQQTDVQKLNQAWDNFLGMVTGGTSALGSLNSDLSTIGNVALAATAKVQAFGQQTGGTSLSVDQVARALQSFSGTSAQVWQNYDSALTQAGQVTDWLRTAAATGAVTYGQYKQSIKGVVAELLPYAKHSQTAAAELSVLVQQAGGPATSSYAQLAKWVGNTNIAQKDLNGTVKSATQYMSNLSQVASNLATTLNSEVVNALAQGAVNVQAITRAAQGFERQLHKNDATSGTFTDSVKGLVTQLSLAGQSTRDITAILDLMAQKAGWQKGKLAILNNEIQAIAQSMSQIHDVNAMIRITTVTSGTVAAVGGAGAQIIKQQLVAGMARGGKVPGAGSGDHVPAMLEPGEAVVPKHLVPHVAPFLGAHGVPGFAAGGRVTPGHGGPPVYYPEKHVLTPMERVLQEWATHIWHTDYATYGKHGPIPLKIMEQIFGPKKFGKTGMWKNPQYVQLITNEQADMRGYYLKDISFWGHEADIKKIGVDQKKQIALWEKDIRSNYGAATERKRIAQFQTELATYETKLKAEKDPYWRKIYRQDIARVEGEIKAEPHYYRDKFLADIAHLRKVDAAKVLQDRKELALLLKEMGYAKGGLVPYGSYDKGGYLPTGLSLAMNNTGRPEPVGHAMGGGGTIHVHLELNGREIASAIIPDLVSSVNKYGYRNSGKATGILRPL